MKIYNNWMFREYRRYKIANALYNLDMTNDSGLAFIITEKESRLTNEYEFEEYHLMFCIYTFAKLRGFE